MTVPPGKKQLYWKEPSILLKGRVENAAGGTLGLALAGGEPAERSLASDGRFEVPLQLDANSVNEILLTYPNAPTQRLVVVQDALDPGLELIEPTVPRTGSTKIDIVVDVEEEHLARVTLGARTFEREASKRWRASDVELAEGENSFEVLAQDEAGRSGRLPVLIQRDTTPPTLASVDPSEGTTFAPGERLRLRLSFDEVLATLTLDGEATRLESALFERELSAPTEAGSFTVALEFHDQVGNPSSKSLRFAVRERVVEKPAPPSVLTRTPPAQFVVEDPTLGDRGWPKRIRHAATGIVLLLVPAGSFLQGLDDRAEGRGLNEAEAKKAASAKPKHRVPIDAPFYLGETEVAIAHWRTFATASGYRTQAERGGGGRALDPKTFKWVTRKEWIWSLPHDGFRGGDKRPVAQVSWLDAEAFCNKYGFALPSESQWEYACRAGSDTSFWWGEREADARGRANLLDRASSEKSFDPKDLERALGKKLIGFDDGSLFTCDGGRFAPNDWGFKDMLGNVAEWCADEYDAGLYARRMGDASATPRSSDKRVLRGGSWLSDASEAHSGRRSYAPADGSGSDTYGFRVAWNPPE